MKALRYILLTLSILLLILILASGGLLLLLAASEYRPAPIENVPVKNSTRPCLKRDQLFSCFTWNIGYAGLGREMDFFYEGGKQVRPGKAAAEKYLRGIVHAVAAVDSVDFIFLQEVDFHSKRSYYRNQEHQIGRELPLFDVAVALNYDCRFVPVPIVEPMGRVASGLVSFTKWNVRTATRYGYQASFPWPKRLVFLKRCFLAEQFLLDNGKELIMVNLHNSAFDENGALRKAEMEQLNQFLMGEFLKGNYVVAGGDWNLNPRGFTIDSLRGGDRNHGIFPAISADFLPEWPFAFDPAVPTNRDVNKPYTMGDSGVTLIDFFVVSPNVEVQSVKTLDLGFEFSDHNPVLLTFHLR